MAKADGPRICEKDGGGLVLPLGGNNEQDWPQGLRITLYCVGLVWCFMGVAIVADVFMGAIEKITSRKKRKFHAKSGRWITVYIWNPTVANLTLMALGSSAPEILLSVVEIIGNDFESGKLGPSTIVGSAAFNLLIIIAICVSAFPNEETRKIKELSVFAVTSTFSILAYLWLLVVLVGFSEDEVEVLEAVLTFFFFPLLIVLAFLADRGYFSKKPEMGVGHITGIMASDMTPEELAELYVEIRKKYGASVTDEQVAKIIENSVPTSRAKYRIAATRNMTAGRKVAVRRVTECTQSNTTHSLVFPGSPKSTKQARVMPVEDECVELELAAREGIAVVEFKTKRQAVLENDGNVVLIVTRKGDTSTAVSVSYHTREGTAKDVTDFVHVDSEIAFLPGETEKPISIQIVDDAAYEEDEEFYVDLREPDAGERVRLGETTTSTVVIIDDDLPGVLSFQNDELRTPEKLHDQEIDVVVERRCGGTGEISCRFFTEEATATAGKHYEHTEGELQFGNGQLSAIIRLTIKAAGRYESTEMFRLILVEPTGGAKFNKDSDGGQNSCILSIFIVSDTNSKARIDQIMTKLSSRWDKAKVGHTNWREQFINAIYVNGDDDEDDDVALAAYLTHAVLLPWKILFAIVPPTDYCGGWVCFFCSLVMIGGVTAIIGDLAGLLGCVIDIPDEITAITIVALGTSLPDTFASKSAAVQDPHADASVGNVTGSNSVNVFLGLGLPWIIGSVYWSSKGEKFHVPAGALAFSVLVFSFCAVVCIGILALRRSIYGGELGGPRQKQLVTSAILIALWFVYVGASCWKAVEEQDRR